MLLRIIKKLKRKYRIGYMYRLVDSAIADINEHELYKNGGPFVRSLRRYCGFPVDATGPWCAIFISAHLKSTGKGELRSRGARRLVDNIVQSPRGRRVSVEDFFANPRPVVALYTRGTSKYKGHVRLLTGAVGVDREAYYIAGNEHDRVLYSHVKRRDFKKNLISLVEII